MKISSKRLGKLLSLARQQEERRAGELATLIKKRNSEQQRLETILNYSHEYAGSGDFQQGKPLENVQNHRRFLGQLDGLVRDQQAKLAEVEERMDVFYQRWLREKNRRQSIEDSRDDALGREQQEADMKEQKVLDDLFRRDPDRLSNDYD